MKFGLTRKISRTPLILILAVIPLWEGCAGCRVRTVPAPLLLSAVRVYSYPLQLRFAAPTGPQTQQVLVLYATGDGGWRTLDQEIFNWISSFGYPIAGFSSEQYLHDLSRVSDTTTTTPFRLAADYEEMIRVSKAALRLPPGTPTILAGLSRGAGLAVVAAGVGDIQSELEGVLAISLTKEEEHVLHFPGKRRDRRVQVQTYEYLPRLSKFPVSVIQSSRDHYLPAAWARKLFGPDTFLRSFHAVDAANHSFGGACPALGQEIANSLEWITRSKPVDR